MSGLAAVIFILLMLAALAAIVSEKGDAEVARSLTEVAPPGLCANRDDHEPHWQHSRTLGSFWCTADQEQREPWRSERRRG